VTGQLRVPVALPPGKAAQKNRSRNINDDNNNNNNNNNDYDDDNNNNNNNNNRCLTIQQWPFSCSVRYFKYYPR
jgi:hypothetical protein